MFAPISVKLFLAEDVALVEYMYLVLTHMPGDGYHRLVTSHLYVSLMRTSQVAGRTQPAADVCFYNDQGLKKGMPSKICILSCFAYLKSVLLDLLCVFDLFSERW